MHTLSYQEVVVEIIRPNSVEFCNELFHYVPKGEKCPSLSHVCFATEGKTIHLYNIREANERLKKNQSISGGSNDKGFSNDSSDYTIPTPKGSNKEVYQEEAHYFQFCVIEKELIFVNMYGKIDFNHCNSRSHIHQNCSRYNKFGCNRYNKKHFRNNVSYYDENKNKNDPCYQCFIWRLRTRDLSRGDESETILYAVGEPNERSYPRWQLAHIKNKSDICAYFEEVLGIHHHNRHHRGVNSTKPVRINGTRVTTLNRLREEILGHLPQSLKLEKLVFDPTIPLKFNFIKMRSNLQSNANDKKYQTFLSHMSQLGIENNNFDEFFSLILSNVYETVKLNFLYPYIVETQVYIDKYKAKRYQELLMLVEIKHPQMDYYYKYSLVFIVNHHRSGEICSYTLNCINTASITIPNVRLATEKNEVAPDSFVATMNNPFISFYKQIRQANNLGVNVSPVPLFLNKFHKSSLNCQFEQLKQNKVDLTKAAATSMITPVEQFIAPIRIGERRVIEDGIAAHRAYENEEKEMSMSSRSDDNITTTFSPFTPFTSGGLTSQGMSSMLSNTLSNPFSNVLSNTQSNMSAMSIMSNVSAATDASTISTSTNTNTNTNGSKNNDSYLAGPRPQSSLESRQNRRVKSNNVNVNSARPGGKDRKQKRPRRQNMRNGKTGSRISVIQNSRNVKNGSKVSFKANKNVEEKKEENVTYDGLVAVVKQVLSVINVNVNGSAFGKVKFLVNVIRLVILLFKHCYQNGHDGNVSIEDIHFCLPNHNAKRAKSVWETVDQCGAGGGKNIENIAQSDPKNTSDLAEDKVVYLVNEIDSALRTKNEHLLQVVKGKGGQKRTAKRRGAVIESQQQNVQTNYDAFWLIVNELVSVYYRHGGNLDMKQFNMNIFDKNVLNEIKQDVLNRVLSRSMRPHESCWDVVDTKFTSNFEAFKIDFYKIYSNGIPMTTRPMTSEQIKSSNPMKNANAKGNGNGYDNNNNNVNNFNFSMSNINTINSINNKLSNYNMNNFQQY